MSRFAHNRYGGQAGWRSQGVASHSEDAARHRSVVFSYACFGWLYYHQSLPRALFVDRQDVPRAGKVGLGRDDVLPPYIPGPFWLDAVRPVGVTTCAGRLTGAECE
jgi:hypothetical protein